MKFKNELIIVNGLFYSESFIIFIVIFKICIVKFKYKHSTTRAYSLLSHYIFLVKAQ